MQDFLLKRASLAVIILMLTGGCTGCDLNSGSRDIDDQQAITLCWKHSFVPIWDLSTLQLNITAPLFSGSRVYAAYNTEMVCLDASNGEVIWERGLGNPTAFNVDQVVEDDHYVFVAAGPKVYAVNKSSGELAWITNLNTRSERGVYRVSMNRVHDLLVYGDAGYFFFLDASTGSLVDTIDLLEIRYTRGAIPGYPSVDESEQKVFLPFGYGAEDADRGGILCYDAVNREVLWDFQVPPLFLLWGTDLKEADSYANAVAYESGELYVSAAKQVFRLSVEDQQIAWADTLPRTIYWPLSGISISGEETFTETNAGEVLAHGKTDGELSWSVVPSGATLTGRMELIDEELYMFSSGDLIILDSGSGVTRWIGRPGNIADVDKDIGFYSKVSLTDTTFAILGTDGIYCVYRPGRAPDPE